MGLKLIKVLCVLVFTLGIVYCLLVRSAHLAMPHPFFQQDKRTLLIAHRGGAGLWPENTLYAFRKAAEMKVDMLEMDVRATADKELVVLHDSTLERTTNGKGAISSYKFTEIQSLDAGYNWSNDGGKTYPFRGQGIKIPRLEEVFTELPGIRFNIEIKPDDSSLVKPFCQLIRKHGMSSKVLIASFSDNVISAFRQECSEVATSATASEAIKFVTLDKVFLGAVYSPKAYALQVPENRGGRQVVTESLVQTAHAHNLVIYVWTINEPESMKRLLNLKVDGIITDYPDRLKTVLQR
jgi:glycerophosphoryl diester phosphodiesterase